MLACGMDDSVLGGAYAEVDGYESVVLGWGCLGSVCDCGCLVGAWGAE